MLGFTYARPTCCSDIASTSDSAIFFFGRTRQLDVLGHQVSMRVAESIDADDQVFAAAIQVILAS